MDDVDYFVAFLRRGQLEDLRAAYRALEDGEIEWGLEAVEAAEGSGGEGQAGDA